jgi:endonuclease/exonuclease/phosphatase family metal-dependent hydrolase
LDDAWLVRWPQGVDNQGLNKRDQIDHIFLSPGTMVREARYLTTPDSDHPALLVEIGW